MRTAARTDNNQTAIVAALRKAGASVRPLHAVGKDFPDLAVAYLGVNVFMEVKRSDGPPSKRKLTAGQREFATTWNGPVCMVDGIESALRVLRTIEASVCKACGGFVRVTVEPA